MENVRHYYPKNLSGPKDGADGLTWTKCAKNARCSSVAFDCPDASMVVATARSFDKHRATGAQSAQQWLRHAAGGLLFGAAIGTRM